VFFSPFSISTALAMTYAGADGSNAKEMASTMHFEPNTRNFHMAYGKYLSALEKSAKGNIQLRIANRLWGEKTYKLHDEFIDLNEEAYHSPLVKVDFIGSPDGSRVKINDWVAEKTEERIKDLIPSGAITTDTRLVLTNAIYFKGDWLYQFDKKDTRDKKFERADGSTIKTPFMHFEGALEYAETDLAKIIRLPYKGKKQSMVVVLPNKTEDLTKVEESMNANSFQYVMRSQRPEVVLALPKFKMTLPLSLNGYLQNLGMKEAFSYGADFSKMTPSNDLWISSVVHKAFIEIDEEGTEAAAATAVIMTVESLGPQDQPKAKEFIADHPFLFYIIDDETQAILFMGRVMEPGL
jgi:serpin B